MNKSTHQIIVVFSFILLLVSCKGPSTADIIKTDEIRDIEDCIEEGGLIVESEYLKCVTEDGEFPLGLPPEETMEEPGAEDWAQEPFFTDLQALGEPLDFSWDMDLPVIGVHGKSVVLDSEIVFFFRFASAEDATAEMESLKEDGQSRSGTRVYWGEEARYFLNGAVVAVYTGSNQLVLDLLSRATEDR